MDFRLTKPCSACPFRRDCLPGWLGRSRAEEIAEALQFQDHSFPCHATINYDARAEADDDETGTTDPNGPGMERTAHCVGALHLLLNYPGGCPNRIPRFGIAFGWLKPEKLTGKNKTFTTFQEFINHHANSSSENVA